ncbi:uncharacterized protein A1O9_01828 [Exophiala aquamarina CBS 119918]|uniref:Uncharacterized protein n=1 Tax=Exophiala aquamarina CBS 119918 TaxID=1182545 RepID=A0A072Q7G5_9EURO|nr:uncharacterized protein A1O9_01828 [Exophiala aquamarina CBS 119918]KEF63850.1 hypothetical protein A1O9_01828 [Exophiala aquamarina CBS 119918]
MGRRQCGLDCPAGTRDHGCDRDHVQSLSGWQPISFHISATKNQRWNSGQAASSPAYLAARKKTTTRTTG